MLLLGGVVDPGCSFLIAILAVVDEEVVAGTGAMAVDGGGGGGGRGMTGIEYCGCGRCCGGNVGGICIPIGIAVAVVAAFADAAPAATAAAIAAMYCCW